MESINKNDEEWIKKMKLLKDLLIKRKPYTNRR